MFPEKEAEERRGSVRSCSRPRSASAKHRPDNPTSAHYHFMKLFKRIEVWILLLLVVGGLVYVLVNALGENGGYNANDPDEENSAGNKNPGEKLEILQVELERDYSNYLATVSFRYDNSDGKEPLDLKEDVVLKDPAGMTVPLYWLGTMPPLEPIPAGKNRKGKDFLLAGSGTCQKRSLAPCRQCQASHQDRRSPAQGQNCQ